MASNFKTIGIIGKPGNAQVLKTVDALRRHLLKRKRQVVIEQQLGKDLDLPATELCPRDTLGQYCDLAIVVGGDGSMLTAARALANYPVPVIGINRGYLGFLTDIRPTEISEKIDAILDGEYISEKRFLLHLMVLRHEEVIGRGEALNDIVLYPGQIARLIEFEVHIKDQFVYSHRADGLIVATPTGSTAYALSGGGPILHPNLNALVLVPMFPHTLSSRPIVVDGDNPITVVISGSNENDPRVSCDGQIHFTLTAGDRLQIRKKHEQLWLLHPSDHDYYHVLRTKLGWGSKL